MGGAELEKKSEKRVKDEWKGIDCLYFFFLNWRPQKPVKDWLCHNLLSGRTAWFVTATPVDGKVRSPTRLYGKELWIGWTHQIAWLVALPAWEGLIIRKDRHLSSRLRRHTSEFIQNLEMISFHVYSLINKSPHYQLSLILMASQNSSLIMSSLHYFKTNFYFLLPFSLFMAPIDN